MIEFHCKHCDKLVSVSKQLEGKRINCPHCYAKIVVISDSLDYEPEFRKKKTDLNLPPVVNTGKNKVPCQYCGKIIEVQEIHAGKKVRCPSCQKIIEIPIEIMQTKHKERSSKGSDKRRTLFIISCCISPVMFFATMMHPPSILVLINYIFLISTIVSSGYLIYIYLAKKYPSFHKYKKLYVALLSAFIIVVLVAYGSWDRYEDRIETADKLEIFFLYRFSRHPYYYACFPPKGDDLSFNAFETYGASRSEGPLSDTGKYHGKWTFFKRDPFRGKYKWYWYGQEISEGEWHLRNK